MPDLPVVGKVPKGWVVGVVVISGGVLGYAYYRHRQTAAAASAAPAASTAPVATPPGGDQYPPDGTTGDPTDPNSTDPDTGMTYGDEALYGGGSGGYGTSGFFPGSYYGSGGGSGSGVTPGPGAFTTNADWAQYAEQQLSGTADPTALSAALGVYLTGRAATSDQVNLIDQAIAVAGYPPVAGPGNNPPGIVQGGTPGPGGTITGLKATAAFDNVTASWQPVSGATSYQMVVTTQKGAKTLGSTVTTGPSGRVSFLPQKTDIAVHVTAQPGGQTGTVWTATK